MKTLILLLSIISINSYAVDYEMGVSYARIKQELLFNAGHISFPMDAVIVSGTAWSESGFGFRLSGGRSTETANSLYINGSHHTNKITALYSVTALYRFGVGEKLKLVVGVGKTDYKAVWTTNGEVPSWGGNDTDSDWSYHIEATYPIEKNVFLSAGYAHLYDKHKLGYGDEKTTMFTGGLTYLF